MTMKGTVLDLMVIGIVLFITALIFMFFSQFLQNVETQIQAQASVTGLNTTYIDKVQESFDVFDGAFVLLLFGFGAASILGAFKIDSHPAFFIFSFLTWIILIFLSTIFSNMMFELSQAPQLAAGVAQFDLTIAVLLNLPTEMAIIGGIIIIVLLGKAGNYL